MEEITIDYWERNLMRIVDKGSYDEIFSLLKSIILPEPNFSLLILAGIEGSGEMHLLKELKDQYQNILFVYDTNFKIKCLWQGLDCKSSNAYDDFLLRKLGATGLYTVKSAIQWIMHP